jgi:hypothetical protein
MAGGWNFGPQIGQSQDLGSLLASSGTVGIAPSDTAFTKGPWTEVVSATGCDSSWVMVDLRKGGGSSSGGMSYAFDIGVGPSGSEVAVVQNLLIHGSNGYGVSLMIPLAIRAGSRVSVRQSSDMAWWGDRCRVTIFDDRGGMAGAPSMVDTYGFISATNVGTAFDPGATANTKGAWTQLAASLTADIAGFFVAFDCQNRTDGTTGAIDFLVDIGAGAGGSEKVVLPNFYTQGDFYGGTVQTLPMITPYIPMPIRAGTRIAVRAQSATNTSPDRILGATFYGVRM